MLCGYCAIGFAGLNMGKVTSTVIRVGLMLSLTLTTAAQNQPLAFEVASVKPSPPPPGLMATLGLCHGTDTQLPTLPQAFPFPLPAQGRCVIRSLSLTGIISVAYPTPAATLTVNERITGGPGWVSADQYDIEAKAEDVASATDTQLKAMLRQLLTDRFKLRLHMEQKEVNGFALIIAKGGPKLKAGNGDYDGIRFGGGTMTATNASMAVLARSLAPRVGGAVVDQTGLKGGYAFSLPLTRDNDPTAPVIFTLLQEELGLRLESTKVPVDIIVIDHAEKPTQN
jgi:uncharacterized protein (TIGR03435 family)